MNKKDFLQKADVHTYGKVIGGGGRGHQFCIAWEPVIKEQRFEGFKYLIFAYGKKAKVLDSVYRMLKECNEEEIKKLNFVDASVRKIPIALRGGIGLNCF